MRHMAFRCQSGGLNDVFGYDGFHPISVDSLELYRPVFLT